MAEQVIKFIKFRCYNLSFEYETVLKDYLNKNYTGIYQCVKIYKYSFKHMRYLDEDFNEKDLEGDTIPKIAKMRIVKMRNINTNEIIDMEIYYDVYQFKPSIKVYFTPESRKLFPSSFLYHQYIDTYPTIQDRGEIIFNILIAKQQIENEVSPNVKQVIQNSDLNRYLMGFI